MEELKPKLILDGRVYKLSYTAEGRQQKVSIKNEKDITLMAAKRVADEVTEIIAARYSLDMLVIMKQINDDAIKAGYVGKLLKYSTLSIELAFRILYPDEYTKFKVREEEERKNTFQNSPLEILNIGCTSAGKTLFILRNVLSDAAFRIFSQALTSIKETTACSIVYHVNSCNMRLQKSEFALVIRLKDAEEIRADITMLIIETFEEFIETIRSMANEIGDITDIQQKALIAVEKRLELNYDKTFGLGKRGIVGSLAIKMEKLINEAMLRYYGNSKSIERLAEEDSNYLVRQLVADFKTDRNAISNDEVLTIANQYKCEDAFLEIEETIYNVLDDDLRKFNALYGCDAREGNTFKIKGDSEGENTLLLISHILGNKKLQRKHDFFTIEPYVKCADIYLEEARFDYLDRELILSDSVGVNQGQKDSKRLKEVALNRVRASIVERNPDIIIYHTKLDGKDDYMVDIVKSLNIEGYGKVTHIVAGRLDTILKDRVETEGIELEDLDESEFDEFIEEVREAYVEKDNVTLSAIIGERYYLCDKTSGLTKKVPYASKYMGTKVLDSIINAYTKTNLEGIVYNDVNFMNFLKKYYVCENVYAQYLKIIPNMIPMEYANMRWNTLQKAIETLYFNRWGFDVLCPALNIRKIIAIELNKDETNKAFESLFGDKADDIKQRFLLKVTEVAQTVLVTEFKTFMTILLRMRYDATFRTDFSTSMTNDRKANLQRLYRTCLEQEGLRGEYSMEMIFHIAWLRTIEFISEEINH